MISGSAWAWVMLALAAVPFGMLAVNLVVFRRAPRPGPGDPRPAVSVLIPARNEAKSIEDAVTAALASRGVELEIVVLDDHSDDDTAAIVRRLAQRDPRVGLETAPPLPPGWNGKQHACWTLAGLARHDRLVWIDADVRLEPDALARMAGLLDRGGAALVSGFPRQVTGTLLEKLVVPQIHWVLLGYLPIPRMRRSAGVGYGAGCGQLFMARREAYEAAGGHAAIRASMHDGVMLPRAFRRAGYLTDLFDATDAAVCRMYDSAVAVWQGFAKNATEGMASPRAIGVWTVLLGGGQVLPWTVLGAEAAGLAGLTRTNWNLALLAAGLNLAASLAVAARFRQSWVSGLLRPLGVAVLLGIQWYALGRKLLGRPAVWRGRPYAAG